jgi:hypothetical protein
MLCDAFRLPKSVIADANTIEIPTLQVRVWDENADVGDSQWAAETMGIWQDKGGLTTQWIDKTVTEHIREIAHSMRIINTQGTGPEQCHLLIHRCITEISGLESERPLSKMCMAVTTNLDGPKLKAALDDIAEVGRRQRKNTLEETLTAKRKHMHLGIYFIDLMLLLLFLMLCRSRRR